MEIVRDYLYSYIHFQTLYEKYKTHTLTFDDVEEFVTDKDPTVPLFNLKESCHMLFRYQEEEHCSDEEKLLDLAVGSIFHEAMKLRENLYQLEVYKPRYLQIQDSKETSDYERNLLQEFIKIGARTEKRLAESVKETKRLLRDTLNQLAHLLPRYKNNHALMRFLLRNKEFMQQAFGQRKGLKIIALKMTHLSDKILDMHYEHLKDKLFFSKIKNYMKSAPSLLLVLEGNNVIEIVRRMAGPTKGYEAVPGTIRGDYSMSQQNNIVHASDSSESAQKEIKRFFTKNEIFPYKRMDWEVIYAEDER